MISLPLLENSHLSAGKETFSFFFWASLICFMFSGFYYGVLKNCLLHMFLLCAIWINPWLDPCFSWFIYCNFFFGIYLFMKEQVFFLVFFVLGPFSFVLLVLWDGLLFIVSFFFFFLLKIFCSYIFFFWGWDA